MKTHFLIRKDKKNCKLLVINRQILGDKCVVEWMSTSVEMESAKIFADFYANSAFSPPQVSNKEEEDLT